MAGGGLHRIVRSLLDRLGRGEKAALEKSCVTLERPIFIWGTGRSGTHLLYDAISLHPDLCFVSARKRWKKGIWGDMHHGDSTPEALRGFPIPVEGMQSTWQRGGVEPMFRGRKKREKLAGIDVSEVLRSYGRLAGVWRWGECEKNYRILDKTPTYIMMVEIIDAVFPDAYHVFCVRDPRAVLNSVLRIARFTGKENYAESYRDGFFANMYPDGYEEYLGRPLVEVLSWQIEQIVRLGFSYRSLLGDRLIPFRYEELVSDARGSVRRLWESVGLGAADERIALLPERFQDYSPRWPGREDVFEANEKVCFSSGEMQFMTGLERLAEELGYDEGTVGRIAGAMRVEEPVSA